MKQLTRIVACVLLLGLGAQAQAGERIGPDRSKLPGPSGTTVWAPPGATVDLKEWSVCLACGSSRSPARVSVNRDRSRGGVTPLKRPGSRLSWST